ncbi:MAG: hypothetical protein MUC88_27675, partial [Planctomycetes bacterium]|nr:hypothetical protein [Planctomycetota bacterium]
SAALLRLIECQGISIRNCHPPTGTSIFLSLAGKRTTAVSLHGNDFENVGTICSRSPEVTDSAVRLWSNDPNE